MGIRRNISNAQEKKSKFNVFYLLLIVLLPAAALASVAAVITVSVSLLATTTGAVIYMDENFDGAGVLEDQVFPVLGIDPEPIEPLAMGINLRYLDTSPPSEKVVIGTNTGSVTSDRSFEGVQSLCLESGQVLAVAPGEFPHALSGLFRHWQFAVNTDAASVALTSGTQIGHYKIDFSTDETAPLDPHVTIQLNLIVNGTGGADLVCANDGATLGTLTGAEEDWLFVSIISQQRLNSDGSNQSTGWRAYDPLADTFKGPQPVVPDPFATPDPDATENFTQIASGVHIFVGDNTAAKVLTPDDLGNDWGFRQGETIETTEIGWEFAAENGGTIYIDDLYWDAGEHLQVTRGFDREQGARIHPFTNTTCTQVSEPTNPDPPNGATDMPVDQQLSWEAGVGVFYNENFDDGQAQGWDEDVDANWEVVSNEYRAFEPAPVGQISMMATYGGQDFDDFSYEARLRRGAGDGPADFLVFRATADLEFNPPSTGSSYVFGIAESFYVIFKNVSGVFTVLSGWNFSPFINPPTEWNILKVVADGSQLDFYINGELVETVIDGDLTSGRIGLLSFTNVSPNSSHFFDDVVVDEPMCFTTYDVYFGTDPGALSLICQDVTVPSCDPGRLEGKTTYYWQVIAKNCCGQTPGPIWSFTTCTMVDLKINGDTSSVVFTPADMFLTLSMNPCGVTDTVDWYFAYLIGGTPSLCWVTPVDSCAPEPAPLTSFPPQLLTDLNLLDLVGLPPGTVISFIWLGFDPVNLITLDLDIITGVVAPLSAVGEVTPAEGLDKTAIESLRRQLEARIKQP